MSRRTTRQDVTAFAYDKRGRLLAVGKNSYAKTHRLQAHYGKLSGNSAKIYLHAEVDALIRGSKRGRIHKLVVVRQGANGYLLAKPCASCQLALTDYGVKNVEHT